MTAWLPMCDECGAILKMGERATPFSGCRICGRMLCDECADPVGDSCDRCGEAFVDNRIPSNRPPVVVNILGQCGDCREPARPRASGRPSADDLAHGHWFACMACATELCCTCAEERTWRCFCLEHVTQDGIPAAVAYLPESLRKLARDEGRPPSDRIALLHDAMGQVDKWFDDGVISANEHRNKRGPIEMAIEELRAQS